MRIEKPPVLSLSGFELRPLVRTDLPAWFAYLSIPKVVEHTSWALRSVEDLESVFEGYESKELNSARRMAIVETAADTLIGTIGFHSVSLADHRAEIAYDLAPPYWGRGIASAACETVTTWSYDEFGFHRVQGATLHTNTRSARVLEKCRFRYEGLLRAYRMVRGQPGDFRIYARLADD